MYIRGFQKMVVPQKGWFIMGKPFLKWDDLGVPPSKETSIHPAGQRIAFEATELGLQEPVGHRNGWQIWGFPPGRLRILGDYI